MLDLLHPLETFLPGDRPALADGVDYYYQGICTRTGETYRLPRTLLAKAVAQGLMAQLGQTDLAEGKMYGVLLVQTAAGDIAVLKAFSGLWRGQDQWPGWVPPVPGRGQVALQEAHTLDRLNAIKDRLIALQQMSERNTYAKLQAAMAVERECLNQRHRDRKQTRDRQRQTLPETALTDFLHALDQESRADKAERRRFKQQWRDRCTPLETAIQVADAEIAALKQQRRELSRQLQTTMHAAYQLFNFAGESVAIAALGDLPTGTGACCAPKLLMAAAQQGLTPLAMAEFWWGPPQGDRQPGEFYGACVDRCQAIMGFLLGGLSARVLQAATPATPPIELGLLPTTPRQSPPHSEPSPPELEFTILYEDDWVIAIDKPAGLLSVPGRYSDRQDSLLTRLQWARPEANFLQPVHRLDQDTSGLLLLALDADPHRSLSQQFQRRQVQKTYQAIVTGIQIPKAGLIDLPLWGDPAQRPRQSVNWAQGKPSQTRYEVLGQEGEATRVAFYPITGRTHQLRVHAAHPQGLKAPIVGDRLYDYSPPTQRLHLHAERLQFIHPQSGTAIDLKSAMPF